MVAERAERTETGRNLVRHDISIATNEAFRVRDSEAGGFDHHIRLLNNSPIQLEVVDATDPHKRQTKEVDEGKPYGRKDTYRLYPQPEVDGQRQFIIVAKKGVEVETGVADQPTEE